MAQEMTPFKGLFDQQTQADVTKHAADAPKTGFQNLPPGILGGVAKLTSIVFKQFDANTKQKKYDGSSAVGEWYYQASGVVMSPNTVTLKDGQVAQCAGLQTRTTLPLCDVKRGGKLVTKAEMIRRAMDEMKLLANNQYVFCDANRNPRPVNEQLLEQVASTLVKLSASPPPGKHGLFFRFDTSQGEATKEFPNPMVFENWRGSAGLENYVPPNFRAAAVQDANAAPPTQPTPQAQPQTQAASPPPSQPPATATAAPPDDDDAEALVKLAGGDATLPETAPAQHKLAAMARANGWSDGDIEEAPNWDALGVMAKSQKQSAAAPHANGAPTGPKKGDVWGYVKSPYNDNGRWRNAMVHVTEANADGTFELLNWDDKTTKYSKVPASDLAPA